MPKSIETLNGYIDMPDYTNPEELSKDLGGEYQKSWISSVGDKIKGLFDAFTPEMPTSAPTTQDYKDKIYSVVDQAKQLKSDLNTAVNGPDVYSESYTGNYDKERMDAINTLVSQYGLTSGVGSAGQVGAGSVGTFIGPRGAFQAEGEQGLKKFEDALQLMKEGKSKGSVFDQTGVFKGADGRLRFEISDKDMKINDVKSNGKLGDILDHPELFKYYPELKDVTIHFDPKFYESRGSFNINDKMGLSPHISAQGSTVEEAKDSLIHEIQHYVQWKEGFAEGGSPSSSFKWALDNIQKKQERVFDKMKNAGPEDAINLLKESQQLNDLRITLWQKYAPHIKEDKGEWYNYNFYKSLYGEVEAENAALRRTMIPEERMLEPPEFTEGMFRKNTISIMNGGEKIKMGE